MSDKIEQVYLPQHLLEPFFHKKTVRFAIQRVHPPAEQDYQERPLNLTAHVGGKCEILVYDVKLQDGGASIDYLVVSQRMLDNMKWEPTKGHFLAIWKWTDINS